MKLDFASFAFGYNISSGGSTPSWGTALGQGAQYKIKNHDGIDEIMKGMVYSALSIRKVSLKIGKGGKMCSGSEDNTPIVSAALFNKVYINDTLIENGKYILIITKDTSIHHAGRLHLKYGLSNTYQDGAKIITNSDFFDKAKNQLGWADKACFFISEINVKDQDALKFTTYIVDTNDSVTYANNDELHNAWEQMMKQNENKNYVETFKRMNSGFKSHKGEIHYLNRILYGAPGTGKTYSTSKYAVATIENKTINEIDSLGRKEILIRYNKYLSEGKIVFTTFHQNYSYEDFIQGIRPNVNDGNMRFSMVDGIFKQIVHTALANPKDNYVIIIDEINRANISKVFGELITLIEPDKRWGEDNYIIATLPSGELFVVPNNLYIVGTMNSADKSISLIDVALRRRFEFIEFRPDSKFINDQDLKKVFITLNESLEKEFNSSDLLIGHSYFIGKTKYDLPEIMNNTIIPLLYEYFFDNKEKVSKLLKEALKGIGYEVNDSSLGRIVVK